MSVFSEVFKNLSSLKLKKPENMNFKSIKNILPVAAIALSAGLVSCVGDLDVTPIDPSTTMVADEPALYTKCYANMVLAGQTGKDGDCDIDGLDGGTTGFVRQLFNAQELGTDESICAWGDPGIPDFNYNQTTSAHPMLQGFYYRLYNGINYCNHYLDVCGGMDTTRTAEVRFLRALYYYYLMDLYGNVPFTLHLSSENAHQIKRADLFNWIEAELLGKELTINAMDDASIVLAETSTDGCLAAMQAPVARTDTQDGYGRADQDAANLLLARMYLNAEVYTGTARWADAKTYAEKVISGPHKLWTTGTGKWSAYQMLFMGDNGKNGSSVEAILPLLNDGITTTAYGCTYFMVSATWKADMEVDAADGSCGDPWSGNRTRSVLLSKFFPTSDAPAVTIPEMVAAAGDDRALFHGKDRELVVSTPTEFTSGYSVGKFRSTYSDGGTQHDAKVPDTDFFLMRSAEAYLIAGEADARLNGGTTTATGTGYLNQLRTRANAATYNQFSLNQILDERARELYYEGFRRTDLVRYGYYGGTSDYKWEWKGGSASGVNFSETRNIFALPYDDINANPNLTQNPGY